MTFKRDGMEQLFAVKVWNKEGKGDEESNETGEYSIEIYHDLNASRYADGQWSAKMEILDFNHIFGSGAADILKVGVPQEIKCELR